MLTATQYSIENIYYEHLKALVVARVLKLHLRSPECRPRRGARSSSRCTSWWCCTFPAPWSTWLSLWTRSRECRQSASRRKLSRPPGNTGTEHTENHIAVRFERNPVYNISAKGNFCYRSFRNTESIAYRATKLCAK